MKKVLTVILAVAAVFFSACSAGDGVIDFAAAGKASTTFKVSYNANGGSGAMSAQEIRIGVPDYLRDCTFNPPDNHYRFSCWNTKADGTGVDYQQGDKFSIKSSNQVLYAKWEVKVPEAYFAFESVDLPKSTTEKISFQKEEYTGSYDSKVQKGNCTLYYKGKELIVSTNGNVIYLSPDSSYMFSNCYSLKSVDFSGIDTSFVTNMYRMFANCPKLTSLDLSGFDTSYVTDMSYMFTGCTNLVSLDVSNFDTSKVTDMSCMFSNCNSLISLDLSHFDTSKVTDMSFMFNNCNDLKYLDVSSFDASNVTKFNYMFSYCYKLEDLDLSNFITLKAKNMTHMFFYCYRLKELDLSGFDTSIATDMSYMFQSCYALEKIDLSSFATSNVTDMSYMFCNCYALAKLDLCSFDTSRLAGADYMFANCNNTKTIYADPAKFVTNMISSDSNMFLGCSNLTGAIAYDAGKKTSAYANCNDGYFTKK